MNARSISSVSLPLLGLCCLCLSGCDRSDATSTTRTTSGSVPAASGADDFDLMLVQQIRKALADDGTLSLDAKNVKVVAVNGMVTLRGEVKNENERWRVASKVAAIAGANRVDDQIDIEQAEKEVP
jgi:hyperosmotically inducible protein